MAQLSEVNSWNVLPIFSIDTADGASLAFIDTVCASPTVSSGGTAMFVMTVRASQPSTMGTDRVRTRRAIVERSGARLRLDPPPTSTVPLDQQPAIGPACAVTRVTDEASRVICVGRQTVICQSDGAPSASRLPLPLTSRHAAR